MPGPREWLFTFPLPPIPVQSIPIPSHSHSQFFFQFTFPWESHGIPIPIGNPIPWSSLPYITVHCSHRGGIIAATGVTLRITVRKQMLPTIAIQLADATSYRRVWSISICDSIAIARRTATYSAAEPTHAMP